MEAGLRADDGWLTLIGLFWLEEGDNTFGAAGDNQIHLPEGRAPMHAGSFRRHDGAVELRVADGEGVRLNGQPAPAESWLRADVSGEPDLVTIGDITMQIIQRGQRYGVRARDRRNPTRKAFEGRRWYPIDEAYCVDATFTAHAMPTTLPIQTVLGTTETRESPGFLTFTLGGREHTLDALEEGERLFIIFRDLTSGDTTYPACRYLKTPLPYDGHVTLDFNRAYSPPCAFTDFATCPLPPPRNRLSIRVEAGELYQKH
jgi:uncharacterized protein (DUF1684 family)